MAPSTVQMPKMKVKHTPVRHDQHTFQAYVVKFILSNTKYTLGRHVIVILSYNESYMSKSFETFHSHLACLEVS